MQDLFNYKSTVTCKGVGAGGYSDSPGLKANGYTFSAGPTQRQTNSPTVNLKRPISSLHVFGPWEEARVVGVNSCRHGGGERATSDLLVIESPIFLF